MEAIPSFLALALLQELRERFKSLVIDEAVRVIRFNPECELNKLEGELLKAQALQESFQLTNNKSWQHWVGDLTRVCYDAEDLIDDIVLGGCRTTLLVKILSYFTKGSMAQQMQDLQDRLKDIVSGLDIVNKTKQKKTVDRKEQLLPPVKLIGRDADKESIIALLLEEKISFVSVVGIAGLGKTTLAHNVQCDSRIRDNFHHIVWVSVSSNFDLATIKDFLIRYWRQEYEYKCFYTTHFLEFQEFCVGKKFLIVLDDLWNVKKDDWITFCSLFQYSSGFKLLLTTSNPNVASVTKAIPYHLQLMRNEDCQTLILDRALSYNNLSERQRVTLEDIAGELAQKCKGLPLVANTLGLLLSSKRGEDEWVTLSERDIWKTSLEQIGGDYWDELRWRSVFQHAHLDDHDMQTYKIHEFIRRFAELLSSGTCFMFEEGERSSSSVHWYKKARHLSLLCHSIQLKFLEEIEKCDGLRTFLLLSEHGTRIGKVPYSLFQKLVRLRVLDLSHTDIDELPESLGRLKHLRYLDASQTHILRLPKSASNLNGLQILKLKGCHELLELPKDLKNLSNLVHLDVDIRKLRCMPAGLGSLNHLKTLSAFVVGKREGYRITELKILNHIRGSICISKLENVKDGAEAREAMMCSKPFIRRLELEWSHCSIDGSIAIDVLAGLQPHKTLTELQIINYGGSSFPGWLTSPTCRLVSIHVQHCRQNDVLPSLGQLPFLKNLHIEGMCYVKYVDSHFCGESKTGAFPSLESLIIKDMMHLQRWETLPDNSMPQLRVLLVQNCPNLFLMQSFNHMNSLQNLEINRCNRLNSLPMLPVSIQSLIIIKSDVVKQLYQPEEGPKWRTIREIPYVEIDCKIVVFEG
ncbi:hypothetical protein SOVF_063530 [Spinacia oleracea]|nr:hypothetical protein SOVF_063530 [Spinacia oleracea]